MKNTNIKCNHIIKMVRLRSRSPGRAGRAMGNGSFERSCTPHEHTLCTFFIFVLPALQEPKLPYHLYKRCFREGLTEKQLFKNGLKEASVTILDKKCHFYLVTPKCLELILFALSLSFSSFCYCILKLLIKKIWKISLLFA